jgi:hypothetical protein
LINGVFLDPGTEQIVQVMMNLRLRVQTSRHFKGLHNKLIQTYASSKRLCPESAVKPMRDSTNRILMCLLRHVGMMAQNAGTIKPLP